MSDAGWNALGFDGLQRIARELGATVEQAQQGSPQKFEDDLADFARRGASVVFAHGFEYQDACERVGAKFPGTTFVVSSGRRAFANGAVFQLRLDEACYLAGIAAAFASKTKKIGGVGGMQIPPVQAGFGAFARGARRARPLVEVVSPAYLESWDDVAKGKEQALALVGAGCDVILHNADHAGLGVFAAAKEKGVLAIGTNRNQNGVEPGTVLASATVDMARAMCDLAREVRDKTFNPRVIVLDMRSGYVDLALDASLRDRIPAEGQKLLDESRRAILAGTLDPARD